MSEEPWERLYRLEQLIYAAVPPIDPPALHWLDSDASFAYCWSCARKHRWLEMGNVGDPPIESDWWNRDPIEENIRSGIDGGFDGSGDDSPQICWLCRCTLRHTLTDYGVGEEIAHFLEHPIDRPFDGEISYTLSRITMNLTREGAPEQEVADALSIVEQACCALGIATTRLA